MSNPVGAMPANKADLDDLAFRARAKIAELKAAGVWHGGLAPHPYQKKPLEWIVEKLGVPEHRLRWSLNARYGEHIWDGDVDPMVLILGALADLHDCGVESATGTGKTFLAACILLWFLACFENSLVITSAPKEDQLLGQLWKEVANLFPAFKKHFPSAELLPGSGEIRMRGSGPEQESWIAKAFVAGVGADEDAAQKAAGFHRPHMLIVTEDTPGIDPAIMKAFAQTRTDDHNLHLALGNPDHMNDPLHRFCFNEKEEPRPNVVHVRISALDHPNIVSGPTANGDSVVPGAIGRRRLAERTEELGVGSRLYESRVRGKSPTEAEDALIKYEWCLRAAERYNDPAYRIGKPAIGVDPSNSDRGDPAGLALWEGACCIEVQSFPCPDAGRLGEDVVARARNPLKLVDEENVGVDEVGVGASTVNAAKAKRFKVRGLGGAKKPIPQVDEDERWTEVQPNDFGGVKPAGPRVIEAERYANQRSQIKWTMREDLRLDRIALPFDPELFQDLCTAKYTTKNGVITVESKEDIKKRLPDRRSPNKGDACEYGNFVRDRSLPMPSREAIPASTRQRDFQLERLLDRHDRQEKKETARVNRMLARHGRERIRAMKRERDG